VLLLSVNVGCIEEAGIGIMETCKCQTDYKFHLNVYVMMCGHTSNVASVASKQAWDAIIL
jgi:hypothetical protein